MSYYQSSDVCLIRFIRNKIFSFNDWSLESGTKKKKKKVCVMSCFTSSKLGCKTTSMDDNDLPVKLTEEPNTHLNCPVCLKLYSDPVINVRCGHTFCRKCVFATTKCPVDNTHCDTSQLVINR